MDWRYLKQQAGITVLFALIEMLLVQNMESGTSLWQLMTMTAIVWLCVSAVLYSDLLQRRQQQQMDNKRLLLDVISSSSPVMVWSMDSNGMCPIPQRPPSACRPGISFRGRPVC